MNGISVSLRQYVGLSLYHRPIIHFGMHPKRFELVMRKIAAVFVVFGVKLVGNPRLQAGAVGKNKGAWHSGACQFDLSV